MFTLNDLNYEMKKQIYKQYCFSIRILREKQYHITHNQTFFQQDKMAKCNTPKKNENSDTKLLHNKAET